MFWEGREISVSVEMSFDDGLVVSHADSSSRTFFKGVLLPLKKGISGLFECTSIDGLVTTKRRKRLCQDYHNIKSAQIFDSPGRSVQKKSNNCQGTMRKAKTSRRHVRIKARKLPKVQLLLSKEQVMQTQSNTSHSSRPTIKENDVCHTATDKTDIIEVAADMESHHTVFNFADNSDNAGVSPITPKLKTFTLELSKLNN